MRVRAGLRRCRAVLYRAADRFAAALGFGHLVEDDVRVTGEVRVATHDVADLREAAQDRGREWDAMSDDERLALAREVEPAHTTRTENTTVEDLHERLVDVYDPDQATNPGEASHLAVGDDDTNPTTGDSALGNEVYRTPITGSEDQGRDLSTTTFLSTSEANGYTLREVGLTTDSAANAWILLNHALISPEVKNDEKTLTIDVTLKIRA